MKDLFLLVFCTLTLLGCEPTPQSFDGERPAKLSEWGLLWTSGGELKAHSESTVYDLKSPLFSDYAQKFRTVWTPPGSAGEVAADGRLNLPVGSVITKTFYYSQEDGQLVHANESPGAHASLDLSQARLLETRILVHTESGWQGLPYIWNEAQTEARLEITGGVFALDVAGLGQFDYVVPDFNQCQGCHVTDVAAGSMQPIGLKAMHLDNEQLAQLTADHGLTGLEAASYPEVVDWREPGVDLDAAARSYLDINCGHCHSRTGPADTSAMFLDIAEVDRIHLGVCKPPVAAGQGTGGHLFGINPGNGAESILTFRMQSDDPGAMMPELGRALVHQEGVELISNWIDSMAGDCG